MVMAACLSRLLTIGCYKVNNQSDRRALDDKSISSWCYITGGREMPHLGGGGGGGEWGGGGGGEGGGVGGGGGRGGQRPPIFLSRGDNVFAPPSSAAYKTIVAAPV